jgi:hypothetical protein
VQTLEECAEAWGFNNNICTNGELGIGSANGPYMPVRARF